MTLSEQYKDPRWQKKRLEILSRDKFACRFCQSDDCQLHVHHRKYARGKPIWEVDDCDLTTLCSGCHEAVTDLKNKIGYVLDFEPHFYFFDLCFCSLASDNWMEFQAVVNRLSGRPKEVARLFKKFFPE